MIKLKSFEGRSKKQNGGCLRGPSGLEIQEGWCGEEGKKKQPNTDPQLNMHNLVTPPQGSSLKLKVSSFF